MSRGIVFTRKSEALPLKQRALSGRRLILVDLENVVGGAVCCSVDALWAKAQVLEAVALSGHDQIVIGTSHHGLLSIGCAWPNLRYVVGSGPDGADHALLAVMEENLADRFDAVVLVSGDGIFAEQVARLGRAGVAVTVVAHPDGLARRLELAAGHVAFLPARVGNQNSGSVA